MEYESYPSYKHNYGENKYKVFNGTAYHIDTPDNLVVILDGLYQSKQRVTLDYGDVKTGKSWGEINDITGTIGRSTGEIKIPLLIHNSRSLGGGAILDHCIIGIKTSQGAKTIYSL